MKASANKAFRRSLSLVRRINLYEVNNLPAVIKYSTIIALIGSANHKICLWECHQCEFSQTPVVGDSRSAQDPKESDT